VSDNRRPPKPHGPDQIVERVQFIHERTHYNRDFIRRILLSDYTYRKQNFMPREEFHCIKRRPSQREQYRESDGVTSV